MLIGQLEDVVAELEGARLDAELFAQLRPEEAELVRAALGEDADTDEVEEEAPQDDGELGFSLDFDDVAGAGEPEGESLEDEIARLDEELVQSRRVQAALQSYLELLSRPSGEAGESGGT